MITVCEHPVLQDALGRLRDRKTPSERFRLHLEQAGLLLGAAALERSRTKAVQVRTPIAPAQVRRLEQPVCLVAVLRAGLGLLEAMTQLVPDARIGHIGLHRNDETLNPVRYYVRLPSDLERSSVFLLDPMLATGGSAVEALRILKVDGARDITLVSLLAAKQGLRRVRREHPDVRVVVAAVDSKLNSKGYIVPGLGDAGDRLFGTE